MADVIGTAFLDNDKREIPQDQPGLALAARVTLLLANQNDGVKNPRRTQKRTNNPVLCPV